MPLENRCDPLYAIENYLIPSMPSFIIFHPFHAIAVNFSNRSVKRYRGKDNNTPPFPHRNFFPRAPAPRRSSPGRHPATPRRAPPAAFRRARTRATFRSPLVPAHGCARACSPPRFTAHEAAAGRRGGSGHRAPPPRGSAAMARRAQAQGARRSSPPPGSPAAREEDKEGRRRARRQRSSLSGEGGGAR